jgi:hypothetical protein
MKKLYTALLLLASLTSFAQLQLPPLPDYAVCDDDAVADGFATFDLGNISQMLYMSYPADEYTVAFYVNTAAAQSDTRLPLVYTNVAPHTQTLVVKVWENANATNAGFANLTLVVNPMPTANPTSISVCDDNNDEMALFDLTTAETQITGGVPGYMVSYYSTMAEAETGMPISDPTSYMSTGSVTVVYVKVENTEGCSVITLLDLRVKALPVVSGPLPVITSCPTVNLTVNSNLYENYTATYHANESDAYAGVAAISEPQGYFVQASGSVWVRVSDTNTGCYIVLEQAYDILAVPVIEITQNGDSITLNVSGNSQGYIYTLYTAPPSYEGMLPFSQNLPTFTNLPAGQYTISVEDGCGNMMTITFEVSDAPSGEAEQFFTEGQTLAAFSISGDNIEWYADEPLTQQLPISTLLADGVTYYATSVTNGNKSIPLAVTARLAAGTDDVNKTMVRLYPNPATSTVTLTSQSLIEHIELYSFTGQRVMSLQPNAATTVVNVSGLQAGVYFLKTTNTYGSATIKVIKQ